MAIEQTIDVPASRRITLDVPPEVPVGRAVLTFTPAVSPPKKNKRKMTEAEEIEYINRNADRLNKETADMLSFL